MRTEENTVVFIESRGVSRSSKLEAVKKSALYWRCIGATRHTTG